MFKLNNKNTRVTSITPFCSAFIVNFEQVDVSWESVLCGRTFFLKKRLLTIYFAKIWSQ